MRFWYASKSTVILWIYNIHAARGKFLTMKVVDAFLLNNHALDFKSSSLKWKHISVGGQGLYVAECVVDYSAPSHYLIGHMIKNITWNDIYQTYCKCSNVFSEDTNQWYFIAGGPSLHSRAQWFKLVSRVEFNFIGVVKKFTYIPVNHNCVSL